MFMVYYDPISQSRRDRGPAGFFFIEDIVAMRAHHGNYEWSNSGESSQDVPTQTAHRTPGFFNGCQ